MSVIPRLASASISRGSCRSAASHSCHSSGVRLGWMPPGAPTCRRPRLEVDDGAIGRAVVAVPAHDDRLAPVLGGALLRLAQLDRREAPALVDPPLAAQDAGSLPELVGREGIERMHQDRAASITSRPRASSSSVIVSGGSRRRTLPCRPQPSSSTPSARALAIAWRPAPLPGRGRSRARASARGRAPRRSIHARGHVLQRGAQRTPSASDSARMPGSCSSTTLAAAQETGLPPNVPPSPPGRPRP